MIKRSGLAADWFEKTIDDDVHWTCLSRAGARICVFECKKRPTIWDICVIQKEKNCA